MRNSIDNLKIRTDIIENHLFHNRDMLGQLLRYTDIAINDMKYLKSLLNDDIPKEFKLTDKVSYTINDSMILISYNDKPVFCVIYKKDASGSLITVKHSISTILQVLYNADEGVYKHMISDDEVIVLFITMIYRIIDNIKYMIKEKEVYTSENDIDLFKEIKEDIMSYNLKTLTSEDTI